MDNNVIYIIIAFMSSCGVSFSRPDATDALIEGIASYIEEFVTWRNSNTNDSIDVDGFSNIVLSNTLVNSSGHYELDKDAVSILSEFLVWLRDIKGWKTSSQKKITGTSTTYIKCYIDGEYTTVMAPIVEDIEPEGKKFIYSTDDGGSVKARVVEYGKILPIGTTIRSTTSPDSTAYRDYYIDDNWDIRFTSTGSVYGQVASEACSTFGYDVSDIIGMGIIYAEHKSVSGTIYPSYIGTCYYLSDGCAITRIGTLGCHEGYYTINTAVTMTVNKNGITSPNVEYWTPETRLIIDTGDARGATFEELGGSVDNSIVKGTFASSVQFVKMEYMVQRSSLVALANAIRAKTGNGESLTLAQMVEDVSEMQVGVTDHLIDYINGTLTEYSSDSVTQVKANAFAYDNKLRTVSFPACTSIGNNAFSCCYSLRNISFPVCNTIDLGAFANCSALVSADFPACTSIGYYAFSNCSNLINANFPVCTSISTSTFMNCIALNQLSFPSCKTIGSSAFMKCGNLAKINFPAVKTIYNNAFQSCSALVSADFPACTGIDSSAFINCSKLTNISFPVCIKIGSYAFSSCSNIVNADFPSCTTIQPYAFLNCYKLSSISFPVCTSIGGNAFQNCSSLTNVDFPVCTSTGTYTFSNCKNLISVSFPVCSVIGVFAFSGCTQLTSLYFPLCETIQQGAFSGCTSLTSVDFPVCTSVGTYGFQVCSNLTNVSLPVCSSIGTYAFNGCVELSNINLPACKIIQAYAFSKCTNLTSVSFPACSIIYSNAFASCYNLSTIILAGSSMCTLSNSNAFNSTPYKGYSTSFSGTPYIYVPSSLVASYKAATNWKYFSKYFSAIEDMSTE